MLRRSTQFSKFQLINEYQTYKGLLEHNEAAPKSKA